MNEEEKKSSKKPIIIVLVYFIAIVILMGMIYSYLLEEEKTENPPEHTPFLLEYNGTIYNNVHKIDIKGEPSEDIELQEVIIVVYKEVNVTQIFITNDTLLSDAKIYGMMYRYPYTDISYFDIDSDDLLTSGDIITITIEPSSPGRYVVHLNDINGRALLTLAFDVE
jgi:hypothetical protein